MESSNIEGAFDNIKELNLDFGGKTSKQEGY